MANRSTKKTNLKTGKLARLSFILLLAAAPLASRWVKENCLKPPEYIYKASLKRTKNSDNNCLRSLASDYFKLQDDETNLPKLNILFNAIWRISFNHNRFESTIIFLSVNNNIINLYVSVGMISCLSSVSFSRSNYRNLNMIKIYLIFLIKKNRQIFKSMTAMFDLLDKQSKFLYNMLYYLNNPVRTYALYTYIYLSYSILLLDLFR